MPIITEHPTQWYETEETIFVNAAQDKVVPMDSPEAAFQLATKGKRIPLEQAVALGLVKAPEAKAVKAAPEDKAVKAPEAIKSVTPAAVAKADELGVDLNAVQGSGADGRITVADVVAAKEGD
jgi:pyruvate/2-oxoglutarate dehydrogenase complex dihydrolipoamide acyltransferase (E2) component